MRAGGAMLKFPGIGLVGIKFNNGTSATLKQLKAMVEEIEDLDSNLRALGALYKVLGQELLIRWNVEAFELQSAIVDKMIEQLQKVRN